MNVFGSIQILHHETRVISLCLSLILFTYFFIKTKASISVRLLTAGLWMFAGNLLCEIPWIFGLYINKPSLVLGLDVLSFTLGEAMIIYVFDHIRRKGIPIPYIDISRWMITLALVVILTMMLDASGFYPLWNKYLNGSFSIDPHTLFPYNLEWSIGKGIGMLGWFWIVRNDKNI